MHRSGIHLPGFPFIRLLVPLCAGVMLHLYSPVSHPLLLPAFFFAGMVLLFIFRKSSYYYHSYWGGMLMLLLISFGYLRAVKQKTHFPELTKQPYFAVLDDYPLEKAKTCQVVCRLINSELKFLAYLPRNNSVSHAKPGDILCFNGLPELIKSEGNPFEFNYRDYLNNRKIGYRIFLKEKDFHLLNGYWELNMSHRALILRKDLIGKLQHSGIADEYVHLISSISFGAREEVDQETIQSFTNTGVIHVLAVSGMNVGLVFVILDILFRFLKKGTTGTILYTIIILLGIWFYALLSGMSASILRAAMMFSFLIIGKALRKNSHIIHSLAVSAFILIAWDPSLIRDVGFQLSYAAVLSIVVIQPFLYRLLFFKTALTDRIWLMLTVTCAAQIGTLPFTLYYFHQFPVYFWLANLAVIPLVTLILYLTFVVIFLSFVSGILTSLLAMVLEYAVRLVLISVRFTEHLPHSVLKGLYPTFTQMMLVVMMLVLLFIFYRHRKIFILEACLLLSILLSVTTVIGSYRRLSMAEVVFFNIPGTRVLACTSGRNSIVLYDRKLQSAEKTDYYLQPYLGERQITRTEMVVLSDTLRLIGKEICVHGYFIVFKGIRIYIQPADKMAAKQVRQESNSDIVWLNGMTSGMLRQYTLPKAKVILYQSTAMEEQNIHVLAHQQHFNLHKAVQLEIKNFVSSVNPQVHCRYFDHSDIQANR